MYKAGTQIRRTISISLHFWLVWVIINKLILKISKRTLICFFRSWTLYSVSSAATNSPHTSITNKHATSRFLMLKIVVSVVTASWSKFYGNRSSTYNKTSRHLCKENNWKLRPREIFEFFRNFFNEFDEFIELNWWWCVCKLSRSRGIPTAA